MSEIVTIGECMAVLYPPEPIEIVRSHTLLLDIGGAEANLAIRMQRLGHTARFISRVGDDPFGRRILNTLDEHGVDTAFVTVDTANPTGLYFREWLPDGARKVYYYRAGSAACALTPADLPPVAFACALSGGDFIQVPAHPVEKMVDPVGAGDAFDAGFLAGLLRQYDLEAALNFGARLGAGAVGALGDYAGD